MEILQIVGYKNSGKTTLAAALIEALANQGVRVASLKHHGHGGAPLGLKDTDSGLHQEAGAVMSGVQGDDVFQLTRQEPWDVEEMLAVYRLMNVEAVIMEGFKESCYKKIVLVRKEEDLSLLEEVTNIKAVLAPQALKRESYPYPVFNREEINALVRWLVLTIQNKI